jgi:hypothetical protein
MPFADRFSYRSRDIFESVICAAAVRANERGEAARPSAVPFRADDRPAVASVFAEDIVAGILESHLFVADLTLANHGVLLEAGIAFGLKSNHQIILLLQGEPEDLHFDLQGNRAIGYDLDGNVEDLATAMIAAANAFEKDRRLYVEAVTESLTPDAIFWLKWYSAAHKLAPETRPALHRGVALEALKNAAPLNGQKMEPADRENWIQEMLLGYGHATRELIQKRLFRTEYQPESLVFSGDRFDAHGIHATELGWVVIEQLWPKLGRG